MKDEKQVSCKTVNVRRTLLNTLRVSLFVLFGLLTPCLAAEAATWYVDVGGSGDATTIQGGIDLTSDGDTVLVAAGSYILAGNRDLDPGGNNIVIVSESGPETTIIDCQYMVVRAFIFQSGEDSTCLVDGFTILRGSPSTFMGTIRGGAILCVNSSPTFQNCIIAQHIADEGAAAYLMGSNSTFINCTISDCVGTNDGGLAAVSSSDVTLVNTIIAFGDSGPAATCDGTSSITASCCNVYGNTGGDWVGCLAGQDSGGGNISGHPEFCGGADNDDYHIGDESPCAAANNSCNVLIGTLDVNCVYCLADSDGDGYGDPDVPGDFCPEDNCPNDFNPDQTDADNDGYGADCECDDSDPDLNPETVWYEDADGDNYGNPNSTLTQCEQPPGYISDSLDCDDTDERVNPNTIWYLDFDGDGYGRSTNPVDQCEQPAPNFVLDDGDCNDTDDSINPDTRWFNDSDADGFGNPNDVLTQCLQPSGYVGDSTDNCPFANNPGQDDLDQDGIGDVCDDDDDGDGFDDLDDNCPLIANSSQEDADGDGIGDSCDVCTDTDSDTWGDPGFPVNTCPDDNCPSMVNFLQEDADLDGVGNVCDNCPSTFNPGQADSNSNGIGDACEITCACPNQGDVAPLATTGDGVVNVLDVVAAIDHVFRSGPALPTDEPLCPTGRGDVAPTLPNCGDGVINVLDVVALIDHVFRSGPAPCDPCA